MGSQIVLIVVINWNGCEVWDHRRAVVEFNFVDGYVCYLSMELYRNILVFSIKNKL